jgi:TonB family protein
MIPFIKRNRRTLFALFLTFLLHCIILVFAIIMSMGNRLNNQDRVITLELTGMPGGSGGSSIPSLEMMPVIIRNAPAKPVHEDNNKNAEKTILGANEEIVGDSTSNDSSSIATGNMQNTGLGDTLFGGFFGGFGGNGSFYPDLQYPKFNNQNARDAFMRWFKLNYVHPFESNSKRIRGKIMVQFVINVEGRVTDVEILDGLDPAIDSAVVRTIKHSPLWTPGKQAGYPVTVRCQMPISIL